MSRIALLASLLALASACSSSSEGAPPTSEDSGNPADSAFTPTDSSATETAVAEDSATTPVSDSGPCGKREQPCCAGTTCESGLACQTLPSLGPTCLCDTSVCDRFGYVCDGNKEVGCGPTAPGSCYVPIKSRTCPTDQPCNPATGTCGGCDSTDACSTKTDGTFLGCMPYVAQWCRKGTDGCVKTVKESCGIACVGGARQGCCGGEGQMCCSPPGAACSTGLTCTSGTCTK